MRGKIEKKRCRYISNDFWGAWGPGCFCKMAKKLLLGGLPVFQQQTWEFCIKWSGIIRRAVHGMRRKVISVVIRKLATWEMGT